MFYRFLFGLSLVLLMFLSSCSKKYGEEEYAVGKNPNQEAWNEQNKSINKSLTSANKIISDKEKQRIQSFIERRGWDMEEISGVYLQEVAKGLGYKIEEKDIVTISYNSYYINGDSADDFNAVADGNQEKSTKTFNNDKKLKDKNIITFNVAGDTKVVYGLLYAVRNLSKGSVARVIVPDNLAFYLDDNGEKIKASTTLIYEIKVENVVRKSVK